jgi:hypothetical protein
MSAQITLFDGRIVPNVNPVGIARLAREKRKGYDLAGFCNRG